ncbi:MAG: hypothetical protein WBP86_03105 [Thiobacillaceae bacterium]
MKQLEIGVDHGGILIGDLESLMPSVDSVSQRFIDLRGELRYSLQILDPTLAEAVCQLYAAKGSFLFLVANAIRYDESAGNVNVIEYEEPSARILGIDMNSFYDWVKTSARASSYEDDKFEWPQKLLTYAEFDVAFHKTRVDITNRDSLNQFRSVLVEHGAALSTARARIREFLVAKFSVEDILYVSRGMGRDEF